MNSPDFSVSWPGRGRAGIPGADGPTPRIEALFTGDPHRVDGAVLIGDGARIAEAHDELAAHGLSPSGTAQLVYLDPPYNRGGRFDAYHDNMPRHEWLDYIETRLVVARDMLAETGTIWVHLDDAEAHRVRCLLDEVFGVDAFIADLTVESNPKGRQLDRYFAGSHDRLMVYARNPRHVRLAGGVASAVDPADFPHRDKDGVMFRLLPLRNTNKRFNPRTTPTMTYPLYGDPGTGVVSVEPEPGLVEILPVFGDLTPAVWRWSRERARERVGDLVCRTVRGRSGPRVDIYQRDRFEAGRIKKLKTIWLSQEVGSTDTARAELRAVGVDGFRTPKPEALMRRIVELASGPGELIVDLFAGSGTTAVAARELGRRWVVVERNSDTVREVLLPRLRASGA
ncbi:site-specific DNA-methyltransferase [Dietzia sp. ANT_WB102]|uniref:site-specific DNA-methyltransferase n=1 Tax=Dietzia sp. ANT_WB102 TaxID=2597345 RepID=UPI0011EDE8BE|nr:site-specific DNA-methyltransferase [Dietzia sp. ANT_WB102]KAA0917125.1 site-specific DNA-methyltransferase [Dietzia sp. ANT_WB102]